MLEGNGRGKAPSADGEPLGRSESREPCADAGCSGHPVLTKRRLVATACPAKPHVDAPGLLLNKWHGSSFTLEVVKQGRVLQSLHERKKFTSSLAF